MTELPREEDYRLVAGGDAFAEQAGLLVQDAQRQLAILSPVLEREVYGTEDFLQAVRRFTLQHRHARLRILLAAPQRALAEAPRLLEYARTMSSFVELRELPEERRLLEEEYLIADGRRLLHRAGPREYNARYYGTAPYVARLKLRDFDVLWNESDPAQDLRRLRI